MKTIRSLLMGLTLLSAAHAPQVARAQPPDQPTQPQPPQSAINPDAKIALPAQFSATQFFDAIARATDARIVAPIPDDRQLAQLRQAMGGQTLTVKEIFPLYEQALGYRFSNSRFDGNLIQVRLPDEMIYPTSSVDENYAALLRLLVSFSREQIDQMYLRGHFTAQDLTPAQIPLYLEARRKNPSVAFGGTDVKSLTDAQILAQPLRLRFSFMATATLPDNESVWPIGLFDYGTGLIWDPLVGADTKALATAAYEQELPLNGATHTVGVSSERARATPINYPQTQATTLGAALDTIERELGQTIAFEANLSPQRFRSKPIVICAGLYNAGELLTAVSAGVGLQSLFHDDVPKLELRSPQKPVSQLPPLVEAAQQKLRRLSPSTTTQWPFFPFRFERKIVKFSELFGAEKFYLQSRLLNENTEGYDQIDFSKGRVGFSDTLWFIANSGGPDEPFVSRELQLW